MSININEEAIRILSEIMEEEKGIWNEPDAIYGDIKNISIDKRGSFGERLFKKLFEKSEIRKFDIIYKNGDPADWDIQVDDYKIEVKTASLDVNNKFQNEGLKLNGDYFGVLFLGVTPKELYFKMIKKEDIPWDKLHDRETNQTGRGFKWDLRKDDMIKLDSLKTFDDEFSKIFSEIIETI